MTDTGSRAAAAQFAADWAGRGDEKRDTSLFWIALLQKVFGIDEPDKYIVFVGKAMKFHTHKVSITKPVGIYRLLISPSKGTSLLGVRSAFDGDVSGADRKGVIMKLFLYLDMDIVNSIIAQTEQEITCLGMITNIIGADTDPCDNKNIFATLQFQVNELLRS